MPFCNLMLFTKCLKSKLLVVFFATFLCIEAKLVHMLSLWTFYDVTIYRLEAWLTNKQNILLRTVRNGLKLSKKTVHANFLFFIFKKPEELLLKIKYRANYKKKVCLKMFPKAVHVIINALWPDTMVSELWHLTFYYKIVSELYIETSFAARSRNICLMENKTLQILRVLKKKNEGGVDLHVSAGLIKGLRTVSKLHFSFKNTWPSWFVELFTDLL